MDNILLHHKIVLNLDIAFSLGFHFNWLGMVRIFFLNRKMFFFFPDFSNVEQIFTWLEVFVMLSTHTHVYIHTHTHTHTQCGS